MPLTAHDIDAVCGLVLDLCGVYLDESKAYLIENRLGQLLPSAGCANYGDLVRRVRMSGDLRLRQDVIDAITTHETLFFRDQSPFEALQHKVLPELIDAKRHTTSPHQLRIWSAACSTGQEPYSIAMTLDNMLPDLDQWNVRILATDISDAAVAKASRGRYTDGEVGRGLPAGLLNRYFQRVGHEWQVHDRLRSLVAFRTFNLHESLATLGTFDVIFCRNVAIYFTPQARQSLFTRLVALLPEYGYLFVGGSESLLDLGYVPLHHCRSVFYQPRRTPHRRPAVV